LGESAQLRLVPRHSHRGTGPLQLRIYEGERHRQRAAWRGLLGWWGSDLHTPRCQRALARQAVRCGVTAIRTDR
jgi:hypothetical protein